jgi:hypothetical protein
MEVVLFGKDGSELVGRTEVRAKKAKELPDILTDGKRMFWRDGQLSDETVTYRQATGIIDITGKIKP